MRIAKYVDRDDPSSRPRIAAVIGADPESRLRPIGPAGASLADLLHAPDPAALAAEWSDRAGPAGEVDLGSARLLAPIDRHEVWGAGVTYERSKVARMAESDQGGSFYDKVYAADRPELFFKATPNRVVDPGGSIRVREDSRWTVPEPELALVVAPDLRIVGYTAGDDVSARDIEGANPLYLPQAKTYDGACALGPWITLAPAMPDLAGVSIRLVIERGGSIAFEGSTPLARMVRKPADLVGWLGREATFPDGVVLLTGTGIVPPDEFTLEPGDVVRIAIDGIGTLANPVARGPVR